MFLDVQIDYLLLLQNFRELTNGFFTPFFSALTNFGEFLIPTLFATLLYWSFNKKVGEFLLLSHVFSLMVNQFAKMLFCIDRPWVLSDKIKPVESALPRATGYSFPSGHTACATAVWGGTALVLWENKLARWALILLILSVSFSRNYLGVHTPQDILFSLVVGVGILYLLNKFLFKKDENDETVVKKISLTGVISLIFVFMFIHFKTQIFGLFINGYEAIYVPKSFYVNIGYIFGVISGWYLCKKLIPFNTEDGGILRKSIRYILGVAGMLYILHVGYDTIIGDFGSRKGALIASVIMGIYITFFYPWIFTRFERKFCPVKSVDEE